MNLAAAGAFQGYGRGAGEALIARKGFRKLSDEDQADMLSSAISTDVEMSRMLQSAIRQYDDLNNKLANAID